MYLFKMSFFFFGTPCIYIYIQTCVYDNACQIMIIPNHNKKVLQVAHLLRVNVCK